MCVYRKHLIVLVDDVNGVFLFHGESGCLPTQGRLDSLYQNFQGRPLS